MWVRSRCRIGFIGVISGSEKFQMKSFGSLGIKVSSG